MEICIIDNNLKENIYMNESCKDYLRSIGKYELTIDEILVELTNTFHKEIFTVDNNEFWIFSPRKNHDNYLLKIYEHVLNNIEEGVLISDEKNRAIFINQACKTIEGTGEDYYLKPMEELYSYTKYTLNMHSSVLNTGIISNEYVNQYVVKENKKVMNVIEKIYPVKIGQKVIAVYSLIKNLPILKKSIQESLELYTYFDYKKMENGTKYNFENLIGQNVYFIEAISNAKHIARNNTTVLIYGETGTGKEIFAQSIHNYSAYQNGPFLSINCAAIPNNLLESIFFGTVKGSYTGAENTAGLFEQARNGTLFLDEINSMDISLQSKLLKAIEMKRIRRLGSEKDIEINCRILCALNEDPQECVDKNKLRLDLYYRLASSILFIPPLRSRKDDIRLLVAYFINKFNSSYHLYVNDVDEELITLFEKYDWPGNVRELEHIIESAYSIAKDNIKKLTLENIPTYYRSLFSMIQINKKNHMNHNNEKNMSLKKIVDSYEKKIIVAKLKNNNYNITRTANELGITRQNLQHKVKKYNIISANK